MCPSAGAWRPVRARGHVAAVPRLPLGCGVPSQGLDTVWWAYLGTWLSIRAGEPRDPEAGQVLGLFLGGWKGKGKPVGLSCDLEYLSFPLCCVSSIKQTKCLDWPEISLGAVGEGQKVSASWKDWGLDPSVRIPPAGCSTLGSFSSLSTSPVKPQVLPCCEASMRTMLLEHVPHVGDPQVPHLRLPKDLNPTMRAFPSRIQHPLCSKHCAEDFLHAGFSQS